MKTNIEISTPAIVDLLAAASTRATKSRALVVPTTTSRFPIVVSGATRDFLEKQAQATGGSLAGLCGAILNEVVAQTKLRAKTERARNGVTSARK